MYQKDKSPSYEALIETSLRALSGSVSYIDSVHHKSLLSTIYAMKVWSYKPAVMDYTAVEDCVDASLSIWTLKSCTDSSTLHAMNQAEPSFLLVLHMRGEKNLNSFKFVKKC